MSFLDVSSILKYSAIIATIIVPIISLSLYIFFECSKHKKQESKEMKERIQSIAEIYINNDNARPKINSGLRGLIAAGITSVKSDYEARQVISTICNHGNKNPIGRYESILNTVNLLNFFMLLTTKNLSKTSMDEMIKELDVYKN